MRAGWHWKGEQEKLPKVTRRVAADKLKTRKTPAIKKIVSSTLCTLPLLCPGGEPQIRRRIVKGRGVHTSPNEGETKKKYAPENARLRKELRKGVMLENNKGANNRRKVVGTEPAKKSV